VGVAKRKVVVTLKENILDPQGTAIKRELESLGYKGIEDIRLGKVIEVSFSESVAIDKQDELLEEISEKLLANPVIEDYRVES